jgi:hypothetical protein
MSSEYNIRKRSEAIAYLKMRGKHLLTSKYIPTDSAHTNVKETMARYVEEISGKAVAVKEMNGG